MLGQMILDFQKYNLNYNNKSISLNILDTIGFIGDEIIDNKRNEELIESIKLNFTHLTSIIFVFSQNRFDKVDIEIANLMYNKFYNDFKNNILIIITHCPKKQKNKITEEFKTKNDLLKDLPIILIDTPDLDNIEDDILEFHLKNWKETRIDLLNNLIKFNNELSVYEIFTKNKKLDVNLNNSLKLKDKKSGKNDNKKEEEIAKKEKIKNEKVKEKVNKIENKK